MPNFIAKGVTIMKNQKTMTETEKTFTERLNTLMKNKNITQSTLADVLGVSRQAVSTYTKGDISPDFEKLKKICEFFDVSTDYMLGISNAESIIAEERFCSEFTGLNTNSIRLLNSISEQKTEKEKILQSLLNNILVNKDGLTILATKIIDCYKAYVREHKDNISSIATNTGTAQFDYRTSKFLACDWFDGPIEDIVLTMYEEKRCKNGNENK